jgi:hypothetical protein
MLNNFLSYNVTRSEIVAEKSAGGMIGPTIQEAIELSLSYSGVPVCFKFNDVQMKVRGTDTVESKVKYYFDCLEYNRNESVSY